MIPFMYLKNDNERAKAEMYVGLLHSTFSMKITNTDEGPFCKCGMMSPLIYYDSGCVDHFILDCSITVEKM